MELNLTKLRVLTQYNKQYRYNFFCTIGIAGYLRDIYFTAPPGINST